MFVSSEAITCSAESDTKVKGCDGPDVVIESQLTFRQTTPGNAVPRKRGLSWGKGSKRGYRDKVGKRERWRRSEGQEGLVFYLGCDITACSKGGR